MATKASLRDALSTQEDVHLVATDGKKDMAVVLSEMSSPLNIVEIDLSRTAISDEQAKSLGEVLLRCDRLTAAHFADCHLSSLAACEIIEALRSSKSLLELDLSQNALDDQFAFRLASFLRYNNSLQTLRLSHNMIRDGGCFDVAVALRENAGLKTLDLLGNKIGAPGGQAIVESLQLQGNQTLVDIKLFQTLLDGHHVEVENALTKLQRRNQMLRQQQESVQTLKAQLSEELARSSRLSQEIKMLQSPASKSPRSSGGVTLAIPAPQTHLYGGGSSPTATAPGATSAAAEEAERKIRDEYELKLETLRKEMREASAEWQQERERLTQAASQMQQQVEAADAEAHALRHSLEEVHAGVVAAMNADSATRDDAARQHADIMASLRTEIDTCKVTHASALAQRDEQLRASHAERDALIEKHLREKDELQCTLSNMREVVAELQAQMSVLSQQRSSDADVRLWESQIAQLVRDISAVRVQLLNEQDANKRLQRELDSVAQTKPLTEALLAPSNMDAYTRSQWFSQLLQSAHKTVQSPAGSHPGTPQAQDSVSVLSRSGRSMRSGRTNPTAAVPAQHSTEYADADAPQGVDEASVSVISGRGSRMSGRSGGRSTSPGGSPHVSRELAAAARLTGSEGAFTGGAMWVFKSAIPRFPPSPLQPRHWVTPKAGMTAEMMLQSPGSPNAQYHM